MGLDMYLEGHKFFWSNRTEKKEGYVKKKEVYELGYWRKHPNLHGYIVNTFADGKDECQEIELCVDDIKKIIKAVKENKLPDTTGFFFGESDGTEKDNDVQIFNDALEWLKGSDKEHTRYIIYQASW